MREMSRGRPQVSPIALSLPRDVLLPTSANSYTLRQSKSQPTMPCSNDQARERFICVLVPLPGCNNYIPPRHFCEYTPDNTIRRTKSESSNRCFLLSDIPLFFILFMLGTEPGRPPLRSRIIILSMHNDKLIFFILFSLSYSYEQHRPKCKLFLSKQREIGRSLCTSRLSTLS